MAQLASALDYYLCCCCYLPCTSLLFACQPWISFSELVTSSLFPSTRTAASKMTTATTDDNSKQFDLDRWQRGGMTSFDQTCFAEYWSQLNSDKILRGKVDPYSFDHLMALGKYLIAHTREVTPCGARTARDIGTGATWYSSIGSVGRDDWKILPYGTRKRISKPFSSRLAFPRVMAFRKILGGDT